MTNGIHKKMYVKYEEAIIYLVFGVLTTVVNIVSFLFIRHGARCTIFDREFSIDHRIDSFCLFYE
ncbi:hypothetical protein LMF32_02195 [Desemzia sp. C1]|uniref:hypothetical protein n=1 Tax=Desemzia sp. C1 TaxID=2892016 RepID=UPI001E2E4EEC|nr:hypothetical protein [Desemzia sp. C1]MCI3027942.1 hypothetical protein [Desemzia sp. C1]